jgi:acetylornithine deacetylase/succinyl-diaminopimelate desuccinylase-like protein
VHPLQRAEDAQDALVAHLESVKPFGLELAVERRGAGSGFEAATTGQAYTAARQALRAAWGSAPIAIGSGGAIPLVSGLHQAVPHAEILLFGAEDMHCNLHAPNERVVVDEIRRTVIAMVEFFERYAAGSQVRGVVGDRGGRHPIAINREMEE